MSSCSLEVEDEVVEEDEVEEDAEDEGEEVLMVVGRA
jgi:hypothetical protein